MSNLSYNFPDISIAPEILRFSDNTLALCRPVMDAFAAKVQERFERYLALLKQKDCSRYNKLTDKLHVGWGSYDLPSELFTPEVLYKVLFSNQQKYYGANADFLVEAIDACTAINDAFDSEVYKSLWTSNGSHFIAYDAIAQDFSMYEAWRLNDRIPCDFLSPYCIKIDNAALNEPAHHIIGTYEFDELEGICQLMEESTAPMYEKLPVAGSFLEAFTNVIVFKKLQTPGKRSFISSTSDYLIGRTLLINPDAVGHEDIIDGLVHENIHSLLNMLEVISPWQPAVELSEAGGYSIVSPWSGNSLTARNFVQANFVWFGLYNFWSRALNMEAYDRSYAATRVQFIKEGFEKADFAVLDKFRASDALMNVLSDMKKLTQGPTIPSAYEQV